MAKQPKTYTAPHPVTIEEGGYFNAGEPFTTAGPKGERWEPVKDDKFANAIDAALDDIPGGVSLEALDKPALQALAAEKNIPTKGLSDKQLIAAIKAATVPEL